MEETGEAEAAARRAAWDKSKGSAYRLDAALALIEILERGSDQGGTLGAEEANVIATSVGIV